METQLTDQLIDSGSIPTHPQELKIKKGRFSDFSHLLDKYHYKGKNIGGGISHHLKLVKNGIVYGGCVLGSMRHKDKYDVNAIELRRMVLDEVCPKNTASYFLSKIIWWLKNNTNVSTVLTFADMTVGHEGTCYKAANFKEVKRTSPSKYVLWNGKRYHCRSLTIDRPYSYKLREAVENGDAVIKIGKPKILYEYNIGGRI